MTFHHSNGTQDKLHASGVKSNPAAGGASGLGFLLCEIPAVVERDLFYDAV